MTKRFLFASTLLLSMSACDTNRYTTPLCTSANYESIANLAGDYFTLQRDDMDWQDFVKIRERDVGHYRVRVTRSEPPNPDFPFSATPNHFEFETCLAEGRIIAEMKAEHHTYSARQLEIGEDAVVLTMFQFDNDALNAQAIPYTLVDRVTPVVDNHALPPAVLFGVMKPMYKEVLVRDR